MASSEDPPAERTRVNRKRRRADGTLRPAVRRHRAKKKRRLARAQRKAWLANFAPGARAAFFGAVVLDEAVFLAGFARATGLDRVAAAGLLGEVGDERGWLKLRTLDGTIVGIAPARTETSDSGMVGADLDPGVGGTTYRPPTRIHTPERSGDG